MRPRSLLLYFLASWLLSAQSEATGVVRVHVVDNVTSKPVAGAAVSLANDRSEQIAGHTDVSGTFEGHPDKSGSYFLSLARRGYRMTGTGMTGRMIQLKADTETSVTVEMLPLGILTGRVLDQYGDPVRHAIVHTEDRMDVPGHDSTLMMVSTAITDDRGEYRVTDVEPGKHYLAVEYSSRQEERVSGVRSRYTWLETGGVVLYPDATSIDLARQIEILPGQMIRVDDVHLNVQPLVGIRGRIKPSPSGNGPMVSVRREPALALSAFATVQGGRVNPDGSFSVDVLPGTYDLMAEDPQTGKGSKPLIVTVSDKGLAGVELELSIAYELRGQVAVDGSEHLDFATLILNFGGAPVKLDSSGAFHTTMPIGTGLFNLQGLPDGWYIKEVTLAGHRLDGRQFEVQPGTSEMSVVLSPQGARVEVRIEGAPDDPDAALVVLLPESGPMPDVESLLHGEAGKAGQFVVTAVPPGSYRVFALDASNWGLLMRPDVLMKNHRASAPLITVAEGERKAVTVPLARIEEK